MQSHIDYSSIVIVHSDDTLQTACQPATSLLKSETTQDLQLGMRKTQRHAL